MEDITNNEIVVLLTLLKDFSANYNANSLSKVVGLTSMGTLKILKKLEKQNLLRSEQMGKGVFYKINFNNNYAKNYLVFLLQKEAEQSVPRVKRWVKELRQLENSADFGMLFGSLLNGGHYNDIDFLIVLEQSQINKVNKLISGINKISSKRVNLVKQTIKDLEDNLKKKDKIVVNAVKKGIVVFGYKRFIEVIENVSS